jgi:hypothetical protein
VLWIRIRKDPHLFGNLDANPDPHPHQIKIRIRICIKIYKLDPDPHQFGDVKPKCKEYEPIFAHFQWFEPIFLKLRSGSGSASNKNLNPDPHQGDESNPDPHQRDADPQH